MAPAETRSASPSGTDSDSEDDSGKIPVIAKLVVYTTKKTTSGKSKTRATKTTKETKTKNFSFAFEDTEESYLELLKVILVKHHIKNLPDLVAKKRYYPMKIQVPPAPKSNAEDVINFEEFKALAQKFNKKPPTKAITIHVDIHEVESGLKKNRLDKDNSESGSDDSSDSGSDNEDGLTGIEQELARFRGMLREQYGNDRDNSLAYTDPTTGENVPLTVFMTKEWARALYDKVPGVSLAVPPNTPTFDLINRQPSIKKPRSSSASDSAATPSSGDTAATQALGTIHSMFGMVSSLLNRENGHPHGANTPATPAPAVNNNTSLASGFDSPLANTPTKLSQFLEYAEQKGVSDVTEMELLFKARGFGPDIIDQLSKEELAELDISRGDGIRLQKLAPKWWEMEKLQPKKRKAAEAFGDDDNSARRLRPDPPTTTIRFEKHWIDKETGKLLEGSASYFGSGMRPGRAHDDVDYCWWFFSQDMQTTIPVPPGYLPVLTGDSANDIQVGDEDSY